MCHCRRATTIAGTGSLLDRPFCMEYAVVLLAGTVLPPTPSAMFGSPAPVDRRRAFFLFLSKGREPVLARATIIDLTRLTARNACIRVSEEDLSSRRPNFFCQLIFERNSYYGNCNKWSNRVLLVVPVCVRERQDTRAKPVGTHFCNYTGPRQRGPPDVRQTLESLTNIARYLVRALISNMISKAFSSITLLVAILVATSSGFFVPAKPGLNARCTTSVCDKENDESSKPKNFLDDVKGMFRNFDDVVDDFVMKRMGAGEQWYGKRKYNPSGRIDGDYNGMGRSSHYSIEIARVQKEVLEERRQKRLEEEAARKNQ
jgi:hypothetical protein